MRGRLYLTFRRISYIVAYTLVYLAFKLLYRTRIKGRQNLPDADEILVVARHKSYLDPPFVGVALGLNNQVHFIAREGLLENPFLSLPVKLFSTTINRDEFGRQDLRKMLRALRREEIVCILPEGTTKPGSSPKRGAVKMAEKTGKVLLPVKIDSDHYPPSLSHPFPRIDVCIGESFTIEELAEDNPLEDDPDQGDYYEQLTGQVMNRIDSVPCVD